MLIDLPGRQFFLRESDIGKPRDASTAPRLAELNSYVPVRVLGGSLSKDNLAKFQVVVLTNTTLTQQLEIDDFTHANGIQFIYADVHGLFGCVQQLSPSEINFTYGSAMAAGTGCPRLDCLAEI